jgi:Family of unknown function (DUF5670)
VRGPAGVGWHGRCTIGWRVQVHSNRENTWLTLKKEKAIMLWTILVVLLILWLLGMVTSYTVGGFIHLLLVVALVILVINLLTGRRTV